MAEQLRYPVEIVEQIRELAACSLRDEEIAANLNAQGLQCATGKAFTAAMISWVRYKHRIPRVEKSRPEELTVNEVMARFGISRNVVYYWIERGVVETLQYKSGTPCWITLTQGKEQELADWVEH